MWSMMPERFRCAALVAVLAMALAAPARAQEQRTGGPYVPTPQAVVDEMLKIANVTAKDYVIDLGSGDGRIVLTAARRYQARGFGVDIDDELVALSNSEAQRSGLDNLVRFVKMDVLETNIREASVITLYLLPEMMRNLRARMLFDLKPGTRVVSHDFDFGDWSPERTVVVDLQEKYNVTGTFQSKVHLWVVPARVQGRWKVTLAGSREPFVLDLKQDFRVFDGAAAAGGRSLKLSGGRLQGARVEFRLPRSAGIGGDYRGTVDGETMRGQAAIGGAQVAWSATRIAATK